MNQQIAVGDRIRALEDRMTFNVGDLGTCVNREEVNGLTYLTVRLESGKLVGPSLADNWELVEVATLGRVSASAAEANARREHRQKNILLEDNYKARTRTQDSIRERNYQLECMSRDPVAKPAIARGSRIRALVNCTTPPFIKGDLGTCLQIGEIECDTYLSVRLDSGRGLGPILADNWELVDNLTEVPAAATPGAQWRAEGDGDPHGKAYDCERAALCMGYLSDDELANAAFLNYDVRPPLQDIIAGRAHSPIAYMTAVKDRIRWLSRKLAEATALLEVERAKQSVSVEEIQSEIEAGMAANQQKQSGAEPESP